MGSGRKGLQHLWPASQRWQVGLGVLLDAGPEMPLLCIDVFFINSPIKSTARATFQLQYDVSHWRGGWS